MIRLLTRYSLGTKFDVTYDSMEKLKSGHVTELPGQVSAYQYFPREIFQKVAANFGLWFAEGAFDLKPEKSLNDLFPDIKTQKVSELMEEAWKKS
jgi:hypothetical protein